MTRPVHMIFGGAVTALAITGTALLSSWPAVRVLPEDTGVIKLSVSHGGPRNCRTLSADELEKLPANMRRAEVCDRQRMAIYLELDIDGETVFAKSLPPSGIAGDGPSRAYEQFVLPTGRHDIAIRLRDTDRAEGFDHAAERTIDLASARLFVIDFRAEAGGFIFH